MRQTVAGNRPALICRVGAFRDAFVIRDMAGRQATLHFPEFLKAVNQAREAFRGGQFMGLPSGLIETLTGFSENRPLLILNEKTKFIVFHRGNYPGVVSLAEAHKIVVT